MNFLSHLLDLRNSLPDKIETRIRNNILINYAVCRFDSHVMLNNKNCLSKLQTMNNKMSKETLSNDINQNFSFCLKSKNQDAFTVWRN